MDQAQSPLTSMRARAGVLADAAGSLFDKWGGRRADAASLATTIALIVVSIAVFAFLSGPMEMLRAPSPAVFIASAALIALGLRWTASTLPRPFYIIAASINLCCVVFLAGSWWTHELTGGTVDWLGNSWPILVGLLAFRWPVLTFVPAAFMNWMKYDLTRISGLSISGSADYIIIPDLALVIAIFMAMFSLFELARTRNASVRGFVERHHMLPEAQAFFAACVIAAAGIHMSNYFWSGWAKLFLPNATPLTWVLENPTYMLAVHTHDFSYLTLQTLLDAGDWFYRALVLTNLPLNILVLGMQLFAIVALLSLRASAVTTAFYDIMHTAIFALTGIFFWKWILLNLGFVMAFQHLRRNGPEIARPIRLMGCALVLAAPLVFHIVFLAWFDTGGVNDASFVAKTVSGQEIEVPTNYFLGASIRHAQQRHAKGVTGYLQTGTWGTTSDANIFQELTSERCTAAAQRDWILPEKDRARIAKFLEHHHVLAVKLAGDDGILPYDAYPHHIWSSPWHFPEFAALDLRKITSYVLVVESRCVTVDADGRINRTVVGRSTYEFPVKPL